MNFFQYKDGVLCAEDVRLDMLAPTDPLRANILRDRHLLVPTPDLAHAS